MRHWFLFRKVDMSGTLDSDISLRVDLLRLKNCKMAMVTDKRLRLGWRRVRRLYLNK